MFVFHKLLKGLLLFYTKLFQPTFRATTKNNALRIAENIVVWSMSKQRIEGFVEGREQGIHRFIELRCRRGIQASNDIVTTTKNNALGIAEKSVIAPIAINRVCAEASKYLVIAALTT